VISIFNIFKRKNSQVKKDKIISSSTSTKQTKTSEQIAVKKGEIGEYKINIQLDQLPKDYRYLSDLFVKNPKSKSGYSQIDHLVISPYGIFVIETKNYQGTIYGGKERKTWLINGKFKMLNPFVQNYGHIQALKTFLDLKYHDLFISIVSFTKRCTFKVGLDYHEIESNELIIYDIKFTNLIERKIASIKHLNQKPKLNEDDIINIYNNLSNANITDLQIREYHNQILKRAATERSSLPSTCIICNKPVPEKVKTYCLDNKRFKGNIYCFDHQKRLFK
jgi:hypothetical protein